MRNVGIIIKDAKSGKFFGYLLNNPSICASDTTIDGVKAKIDKFNNLFAKYTIEFAEVVEFAA